MDKHSNVFSLRADSLAHIFTDSFEKHFGGQLYVPDNIIIRYQTRNLPKRQCSATDSNSMDGPGSAQARLRRDKTEGLFGIDKSLDSVFLRNL